LAGTAAPCAQNRRDSAQRAAYAGLPERKRPAVLSFAGWPAGAQTLRRLCFFAAALKSFFGEQRFRGKNRAFLTAFALALCRRIKKGYAPLFWDNFHKNGLSAYGTLHNAFYFFLICLEGSLKFVLNG
jgi:hypothetical protein